MRGSITVQGGKPSLPTIWIRLKMTLLTTRMEREAEKVYQELVREIPDYYEMVAAR